MWLLLAIALPTVRALVRRMVRGADRRNPSTRTAKTLHQADSVLKEYNASLAALEAKPSERARVSRPSDLSPQDEI